MLGLLIYVKLVTLFVLLISLQHGYASEMYIKLGDMKALLELHVESKHWDEVV